MPARRFRSRTYKRRHISVPGGVSVRFVEKKRKVSKCARCGGPLAGVPRASPGGLMVMPKSSRRPTRPYGGNLCSACARQAIKEAVRA